MKKSKTSQTYISLLIYLFCGVLVFLLTFVVNKIYVSAEGSNSLPYVVDTDINVNDFASLFNGHPHQTNNTLTISEDNCFIFEFTANNTTYYHVYVPKKVQVPTRSSDPYSFYVSNLSVPYDGFNITTNTATISAGNYGVALFYINGSGNLVYYTVYLNENITRSFTLFSGSSYTPVYICRDVLDINDNVVLGLSSTTPSITGHSTPPINNSGHYIPHPHPNKPSPTPYTPPTPQFPTIDTSTLENLVESLIDVVEYGFSYTGSVISGWFSNLVSNVSDYLDYIGDVLVTGFNNVVGSIQDFATDFYNNMVSLIEPIFEFFSGVSNFFNNIVQIGMVNGSFDVGEFLHNLIVPSTSDVLDLLMDNDSTGSHHLYLATYHKVSDIITTFTNLQPIKVFNVPSTTWHGYTIGGFTVDFSWYDDYKTYMDIILSGFLVIGYLYWIYLQLNSLFRGTGSVVYDSLYETPTKGGDSH